MKFQCENTDKETLNGNMLQTFKKELIFFSNGNKINIATAVKSIAMAGEWRDSNDYRFGRVATDSTPNDKIFLSLLCQR